MSELIALNLGDFNLASGEITVRDGEDSLSKRLSSEELKSKLKEFIKDRTKYVHMYEELDESPSMDSPLFINGNNQRLNPVELRRRLADRNLRPLYVKKSRIVHLLKEGKTTEEVEKMFDIRLSDIYKPYEKTPDYRLLQAYKEYHPRA